jgi:8-oxo-dGTP pyrophosphatase MutT (NUDIX family)
MTVNDIAHLRLLEIKSLSTEALESICSQPRPTDELLGLRWGDARYALSLRRSPRRPA